MYVAPETHSDAVVALAANLFECCCAHSQAFTFGSFLESGFRGPEQRRFEAAALIS